MDHTLPLLVIKIAQVPRQRYLPNLNCRFCLGSDPLSLYYGTPSPAMDQPLQLRDGTPQTFDETLKSCISDECADDAELFIEDEKGD